MPSTAEPADPAPLAGGDNRPAAVFAWMAICSRSYANGAINRFIAHVDTVPGKEAAWSLLSAEVDVVRVERDRGGFRGRLLEGLL